MRMPNEKGTYLVTEEDTVYQASVKIVLQVQKDNPFNKRTLINSGSFYAGEVQESSGRVK